MSHDFHRPVMGWKGRGGSAPPFLDNTWLDYARKPVGNDPVSSIVSQHGPNGEQRQYGEWTNADMNTLSYELETSKDMRRRHAIFARMLQNCERKNPAYTVLHQNATFTGKQKATKWRAAPSFAMHFRAKNWA